MDASTSQDQSDSALVAKARGGDRDAFRLLLGRHRSLLVSVCRRAVRDDELVNEATQEAVLQAMLALDRLRCPDQFGSWLAGIGLNVCRQMRRNRARGCWSWETLVGGSFIPEPADWRPGPEEVAEAADMVRQVRRAVSALPPGQRAAVVHVYLSGLTHAEAAAQLRIDAGAVKGRLHKARGALRRALVTIGKDESMTEKEERELVLARVAEVHRLPPKNGKPPMCVVVLESEDGRLLPIWMGEFEGTAIALGLEEVEVPRPLTFAFVAGLLDAAGQRLTEVRITRLEQNTFYAIACIEGPGGRRTIDARPSDALALAVQTSATVRVDPAVLDAQAAWDAAHPDERFMRGPEGDRAEGAKQIVAALKSAWLHQSAPGPEHA